MLFPIIFENSSLIYWAEWDDETRDLTIYFKNNYPAHHQIWWPVNQQTFEDFAAAPSAGKFYLQIIKPFLKLKSSNMSEEKKRPEGINQASDKVRYIKQRIDVSKLKKSWFFVGDKGVYADITLALLPDGTVDAYGNLGMITQDVPKAIAVKEKSLPKEKKSRGEILGNGRENKWENNQIENAPGSNAGQLANDIEPGSGSPIDDLPF